MAFEGEGFADPGFSPVSQESREGVKGKVAEELRVILQELEGASGSLQGPARALKSLQAGPGSGEKFGIGSEESFFQGKGRVGKGKADGVGELLGIQAQQFP